MFLTKKVPKQGQKSWSDSALLKPEDSSVESSAKLAKKRVHAPHSDWRQRRDAAIRRYHQRGLCPIPLKGKRPYQKGWQAQEQYQELSAEAILQRFRPSDNVGLLLGIPWRQRGLFLRGIDYDDLDLWKEHMACASDQEGYGWLLSGPLVRTGNDNSHHYILSDSPEKFVFQGKESTEHGARSKGQGLNWWPHLRSTLIPAKNIAGFMRTGRTWCWFPSSNCRRTITPRPANQNLLRQFSRPNASDRPSAAVTLETLVLPQPSTTTAVLTGSHSSLSAVGLSETMGTM